MPGRRSGLLDMRIERRADAAPVSKREREAMIEGQHWRGKDANNGVVSLASLVNAQAMATQHLVPADIALWRENKN